MAKFNIKVMVGRNGVTRVLEETEKSAKVYTAEQWTKELEKRRKKEKKAEDKIKSVTALPDFNDATKPPKGSGKPDTKGEGKKPKEGGE